MANRSAVYKRKVAATLAAACCAALAGCSELHNAKPTTWYASHGAVEPRGTGKVVVCHGFGCQRKTAFAFSQADLAKMRRLIGTGDAKAERAGVQRMIAWAEVRVAPVVGSEDDIGGLDLRNAGRVGQMDCLDEATNTTSYLLVAEEAGLLRHHKVARPVARGYFLDGRYPHATAVMVGPNGPWAVDSWPNGNGVEPDVMPLDTWFAKSPAR